MASMLDRFPEYASTTRLDKLRQTEYGYLDEQSHVYLDYTGAGLAGRSQYLNHAARLAAVLSGNPHSDNPTSSAATGMVDRTREHILAHLNAPPDEYAVIFTLNATGAARLVGEAYPFCRGSRFVLTTDNHNSINGIRQFAHRGHATTSYIRSSPPELRVKTAAVAKALSRRERGIVPWRICSCDGPQRTVELTPMSNGKHRHSQGLFAYPAQSNFSGVRHPLEWVGMAQSCGYDVLLDAAAYLPTSQLDLSIIKPEFVIISWYKVFGYPTGVGSLIVRRDALSRLRRPWFSGGTVKAVSVGTAQHVLMHDESAFEDGTLNFLSIPDVAVGLDLIAAIGMDRISTRVRCLTGYFLDRLDQLKHSNGRQMATIYGPRDTMSRGGTVTFNFVDAAGIVVDKQLVAVESSRGNISLRVGCFCNPGANEDVFGLDMKALLRSGLTKKASLDKWFSLIFSPWYGAVRVSFGLASTVNDIDRFFDFVDKTYTDRVIGSKYDIVLKEDRSLFHGINM